MVPKVYNYELSSSTKLGNFFGLPIPDMNTVSLTANLVGGSATVNHAFIFKTPKQVIDHWQEDFGLQSNLDEDFEEISKLLSIDYVPETQVTGNNRLLKEAFEKLEKTDVNFRHHGIGQRNVKDCRGCGYCDTGCRYNRKQTPLNVILPEACRHGAKILPNAQVERINFDGKNAKGVTVKLLDGAHKKVVEEVQLYADIVILAAGAMESPRIMMRSGLRNPNIGKRFSCHAPVTLYGMMPAPFYPSSGGPPQSYYGEFYENDDGTLNEESGSISYKFEGIFNHPMSHAQLMPFNSVEEHHELMTKYNHIMTLAVLIHDKPNGVIHKNSFEYQLDPEDNKKFVECLRNAAKIVFAAGAEKVLFPSSVPITIDSPEQIEEKLPDHIADDHTMFLKTSAHPMGGVIMGKDSHTSVVSSHTGKYWDKSGLYVFDGSILPDSPGVNPSYTIFALSNYFSKKLVNK